MLAWPALGRFPVSIDLALAQELALIREASKPEVRLQRRKRAADLLVSLRAQVLRTDGRPDATGRTYEYRVRVNDAYRTAGYETDEIERESAALRHHVSTAARAYFTDLDEYGVLPYDRNESIRRKREATRV